MHQRFFSTYYLMRSLFFTMIDEIIKILKNKYKEQPKELSLILDIICYKDKDNMYSKYKYSFIKEI